jgi:hypothetical protein
MTCSQLQATLAAVVVSGLAACARPATQPRVVGPVIGESTAPGPSNPTMPPPDPGGVTETSGRIRGTPSPVANPAITVDTMPSTLEPSGNSDPNAPSAPVVVSPGVITGGAPVGAAAATGPTTAGPNGPGTGNPTTPTGAATTTATSPGSAARPASPTSATSPPQPTQPPPPTPPPAPTPAPSNGPGTGNTVNQPAPAAPVPPPGATPR